MMEAWLEPAHKLWLMCKYAEILEIRSTVSFPILFVKRIFGICRFYRTSHMCVRTFLYFWLNFVTSTNVNSSDLSLSIVHPTSRFTQMSRYPSLFSWVNLPTNDRIGKISMNVDFRNPKSMQAKTSRAGDKFTCSKTTWPVFCLAKPELFILRGAFDVNSRRFDDILHNLLHISDLLSLERQEHFLKTGETCHTRYKPTYRGTENDAPDNVCQAARIAKKLSNHLLQIPRGNKVICEPHDSNDYVLTYRTFADCRRVCWCSYLKRSVWPLDGPRLQLYWKLLHNFFIFV